MKSMNDLSSNVEAMNLGSQSTAFLDISDEFFKSAEAIEVGHVVKSQYFALFEGTRALEIMNKVLDTGLIRLSDEELNFDVKQPRDSLTVVNLLARLFRSLMTWLNTSSLPATVLSCRYVEECLANFDGVSIESCHLGIHEQNYKDDIEFLLVHKVLLSIIQGILIFIKNVIALGQAGVLYEEEDITITTMGFDFLTHVPNYIVQQRIMDCIDWVDDKIHDENKPFLTIFLRLSLHFSRINDLLELSAMVFKETSSPRDTTFLHTTLQDLNFIHEKQHFLDSLPDLPLGCFSEGIQKRNDNYLPPRQNHMDSLESCISAAKLMVQDLINVMKVTCVRNVTELTDFLDAFMNKRDEPCHVIARAFFQLFLVRDDRSIMGDASKKFVSLLVDDMSSLTCYDCKIFQQFHEGTSLELNQALLELLNSAESAYYSYILCVSQNPCRQRQHFNRSILAWDALQVQLESFEIELKDKYNINEVFKSGDSAEEMLTMPISSWVYYQKLRSMLEVLLRGIELEIYKHWELYSIFWYIEYLSAITVRHIERIIMMTNYKKLQILNMSKKIKKLKAGEKKQLLKDLYKQKQEVNIPHLDYNLKHLQRKNLEVTIRRDMSDQYAKLFTVLHDLQLLRLPKLNKILESLSYGLKMKPFQSVGVPEFPDFNHWVQLRRHLLSEVATTPAKIKLLEQAKVKCGEIKTNIQNYSKLTDLGNDNFVLDENSLQCNKLIKSCVGLSLSITLLIKQLKDNNNFISECQNDEFEVVFDREGYYRSFPLIKINKRK